MMVYGSYRDSYDIGVCMLTATATAAAMIGLIMLLISNARSD
jgi:hypothetical protein